MPSAIAHNPIRCQTHLQAIRDTMDVLSGKWKIHILGTLMQQSGPIQFMDLMRTVEGIAAKMLSKELQDLEMNGLVTRSVQNTKPVTVVYSITDFGRTLDRVIAEIANWGYAYRKQVFEATGTPQAVTAP